MDALVPADIANSGPIAERLRAYVRARVRKGGPLYERGAGARLCEAIGKGTPWLADYTDEPPQRNADVDTAVKICRYFAISLDELSGRDLPRHSAPIESAHGRPVPDPVVRALRIRVRYLETTLRRIAQRGAEASELAARALATPGVGTDRPRRRVGTRKPAR